MTSSETMLYMTGMAIAAAIDCNYDGIQKDRDGLFAAHGFTDPQTRASFLARDLGAAYRRLKELRKQIPNTQPCVNTLQ